MSRGNKKQSLGKVKKWAVDLSELCGIAAVLWGGGCGKWGRKVWGNHCTVINGEMGNVAVHQGQCGCWILWKASEGWSADVGGMKLSVVRNCPWCDGKWALQQHRWQMWCMLCCCMWCGECRRCECGAKSGQQQLIWVNWMVWCCCVSGIAATTLVLVGVTGDSHGARDWWSGARHTRSGDHTAAAASDT